ncbi:MAG: LysM domain-containing protein [Myxococcota bacterium]
MRRIAAFAIVAVAVPLTPWSAASAQPASDDSVSVSPAINAALGAPPTEAPPSQGTFDPGYTDRGNERRADQTYGSSAVTVAADGSLVNGLTITDPNVLQQFGGEYVDAPQFHIVQSGDTLWDISQYYMTDPYLWPKLWSWNDHVTNAHWIFPGDRIRLYDPYAQRPRANDEPRLHFSKTRVPERALENPVLMTQTAFVDAAEFDSAMTVVGGADAKVMLATLDTVYMNYDRANPPVPGERLVVYSPQEKIYDLDGKNVLGYVVEIMGDIEVETIARKTAEGTVSTAVNPIERGYKVGPLRRRFRRIDPIPATRSGGGMVIATLTNTGPISIKNSRRSRRLRGRGENDVLAGDQQFVIVDMGESSGVEEGNILEVVRKGDEYTPERAFKLPYEDGWPRRVIGALIVVQVLPTTSLALVTFSRREFERGDHVELRGPGLDRAGTQADPGNAPAPRGTTVDAGAEAQRGDGKVEGKAGFQIGR